MEIRSAASHAELHACVDLQLDVWGFEPRDAVPFNQLYVTHTWGGQVLVAVEQDQVIGFCYGMPGRQYGKPAFLSHMLGVRQEHRGRDLGAQLKLAQGRWALEQGYDLMTWTYDPLEALNGRLNIGRLGGIVRQYLVNHYGVMTDGLNKGIPSDRMLVEWHLRTPRVAAVLAGEVVPSVEGAEVTCALPVSIQQVKKRDPAEALRWRLQVREQLTAAMSEGYIVTGFRGDKESAAYLLTQERDETRAL